MLPAYTYADVLRSLTSTFALRLEDNRFALVRMTGIVFVRPHSRLAREEIVPHLNYWHCRSGTHIDFFFAGYAPSHVTVEDYVPIPGPDGPGDHPTGGWSFSTARFDQFRQELERMSQWRYSGGCDLLLLNARYNGAKHAATCDFTTAIVCQLDRMIDDGAIASVETFFESIFRFSESATGVDPTWGFSDQRGSLVVGSALKRLLVSLLPEATREVALRAAHFAVLDVGTGPDSRGVIQSVKRWFSRHAQSSP